MPEFQFEGQGIDYRERGAADTAILVHVSRRASGQLWDGHSTLVARRVIGTLNASFADARMNSLRPAISITYADSVKTFIVKHLLALANEFAPCSS